MKLLILCFSAFAMDVSLPDREPLGGSESCAAYLARQLAQNGHDVYFMARLPPGTPERVQAVRHVPVRAYDDAGFFSGADFDATIALSGPATAEHLRRLAPKAVHVSWLHLLPKESAMAPLAAMMPFIDCAVFVSRTQQAMFRYGGPTAVIGNGIAPAFENMFSTAEDLHAAKRNRAAYTSMPYRGLHHLVEAIRQMRGATEFDVYSAMKTYRMPDADFAGLYIQVINAPRTRYHGSVAQPVLATALRSTAFLAYPCGFIETYCIAALEAIAAGLKVVSTDLGALRETTLGFADLLTILPNMEDAEIVTRYTRLLENNVAEFLARPNEWVAQRFEQSQTVNRLCSWRARAREWEKLLEPAIAAKRER
ncbi:MAG TPA: glycosyltransferase family 4 protein [Rhizomicrobium sp.]|nr:glycosyltransferase family 4 protein [Rhizomicrobium sp.]